MRSVATKLVPDSEDYSLKEIKFTARYSTPIVALIEQGRFDWVNARIRSAEFPRPNYWALREVVGYILRFNRPMDPRGVDALLPRGFRHALIQELISLRVSHPYEQDEGDVSALGSPFQTPTRGREFPALRTRGGDKRWLDASALDSILAPSQRILLLSFA